MRCDQCQHWERFELDLQMGTCTKPKEWWNCSEWVRDDDDLISGWKRTATNNDKFFVQDGSDYKAYLFTREDFFCAEFMEKAK